MIRTRIAPSPTGSPHIGTAFIALANFLFSKQKGGEFILRLEDTDRERSEVEHEAAILNSLKWTGLSWAEGPDVGGDHGPYKQSERLHIYQEHIQVLLKKKHAFHCFCSKERLDMVREKQREAGKLPKYDGNCLKLSEQEVQDKLANNTPYVIRMKVPGTGSFSFTDPLRGVIEFPWVNIDMQVLIKADGFPTYHFANVVDDHLMKITHVIRGEEWTNSLPKHHLLYDYFGFDKPEFFHLPLLRNKDRSKLSKRQQHTSIHWFDEEGYLPEAVLNQLNLILCPASEGENELRNIDEMLVHFDLNNIQAKAPIFDLDKLNWLNGSWLREKLSAKEFIQRFHAWSKQAYADKPNIDALLELTRERIIAFKDAPELLDRVYNTPELTAEKALEGIKLTPEQCQQVFESFIALVESSQQWDKDEVMKIFGLIAEETGISKRKITAPFYIATQGESKGLPLYNVLVLLGREEVLSRCRHYLGVI